MKTDVLIKPDSFYKEFTRRPGSDKANTHYCPGCGHGILHKLIAEALEDFNVYDRAIIVSPVGCSVFAYYYFNTGNIQAAHGRAPAVATGLKRSNPDSIIISYQGDGDLAAIGANNIIQAANRGEHITVFFVNNAIYGMTGGQMAPTTLIGQKTTTTPRGRDPHNEGYPIMMSELISTLKAPVYVERVMLADAKSINKTRKAVRKAIQNQIDGKGFSFVEVLSACPTGWKMTPVQAKRWVLEQFPKHFPVGVKKDESKEREPYTYPEPQLHIPNIREIIDAEGITLDEKIILDYKDKMVNEEIKISGFGGQGILSLGIVLAEMGMRHDYEVSWLPSYGPEMRGGTAHCHVKISSRKIGSPVIANPTILIAMNKPSVDKFQATVIPNGAIFYDSSLIDTPPTRQDVNVIAVPATKIADKVGNTKAANMVMMGAIIEYTDLLSGNLILNSLADIMKNKTLIEINRKAFKAGAEAVKGKKR